MPSPRMSPPRALRAGSILLQVSRVPPELHQSSDVRSGGGSGESSSARGACSALDLLSAVGAASLDDVYVADEQFLRY